MTAYATFGLTPAATTAEINRRYRELAKVSHPDASGDVFLFQELKAAYAAIGTPAPHRPPPKMCCCIGLRCRARQRLLTSLLLWC